MLTPIEQKIVLSTLTQRRAWLKKNLESGTLEDKVRSEYLETARHLDAAMKKLAAAKRSPAAVSGPAALISGRSELTVQTARVLVAEDSAESAELLVSMLQDIGIKQVDTATDGREAFDKIKSSKESYDIVFCDWDMPELSGIEVHQKAVASNTLREAHFCMVTAVTEAQKIREAILQGINDYIVKPIDAQKLEEKVKATIEAKSQDAA